METNRNCTACWMRKIQFYRLSRTISKGHQKRREAFFPETVRLLIQFLYYTACVFMQYRSTCLNVTHDCVRFDENEKTWDRHLSRLLPVYTTIGESTKFRYKCHYYYYLCAEFSDEWKRSESPCMWPNEIKHEIMRTTAHNKHFFFVSASSFSVNKQNTTHFLCC